MFNYGHADTTNIVDRHWQFIRYTTLRGRINRSNTDLVHVLIGDSETGTCIGGTIIEWYNNDKKFVRLAGLHPVQIVGIKGPDLKRQREYWKGMSMILLQCNL